MDCLFISLDEYIVPPEVIEVEIALRYLSIEADEEYDYIPSKANVH